MVHEVIPYLCISIYHADLGLSFRFVLGERSRRKLRRARGDPSLRRMGARDLASLEDQSFTLLFFARMHVFCCRLAICHTHGAQSRYQIIMSYQMTHYHIFMCISMADPKLHHPSITVPSFPFYRLVTLFNTYTFIHTSLSASVSS